MGIIAWIAVGLTAGLLANMPLPGKRSRGPYFHLPDLLHRGAEVTVVELKDIQLPDTMNARRPPLPPTERPCASAQAAQARHPDTEPHVYRLHQGEPL